MSDSPARTWYRLGSADIVFLVLVLVIFQAARGKMLSDPGLGWHLRNIDAMIAAGGWLHTDPFTQPRDGKPAEWRTNQWLGELPFWLGERWAGKEGVAAVATLILALTLRFLYSMLLRDGLPWPFAAGWVCIAALGTSCSWIARPNLFTMLFVLLTARVCVRFHEGRLSWRALLWLPPLFTAWANMHGGFVAGFLILAPTLLIETGLAFFAFAPVGRLAARRRTGILAGVGGACFLGTLINPYGWSLYPWVFRLLGDPYFMTLHEEWKPAPFNGAPAYSYELCVLLLPCVLTLSKRRPSLVEIGLTVLWLHLALTGFRYVPIWVLVAVPVMARASLAIPWAERVVEQGSAVAADNFFFARPVPSSGLWSIAFALALFGGVRLLEGKYARLLPEVVATDALDRLIELHRDEPDAVVFHSYNWGGYLTWYGWRPQPPRLLNWIDDRNEVQGEDHIKQTFAIQNAEPGWDAALDRAHVRFVCVEKGSNVAARLTDRVSEWDRRYEDDYAVIFVRRKLSGL